tara:strand:- start:5915 stop:6232 length:318 start_codon:yes stop_codon:yes gene_type:complete
MSSSATTPTIVDFWADLEGSEDDEAEDAPAEVTFESACAAHIPFGKKYKGQLLGDLIRTKSGRSYLRYLLDWDELFEDLRANIEILMIAYGENKDVGEPSKKRKR